MKKFTCSICGYIYDESIGDPESKIEPGTKWGDIPDDWNCPLCGAVKADFMEAEIITSPAIQTVNTSEIESDSVQVLSLGEISALCSNLSKGCTKQYRLEEAELFNQLAEFYKDKSSGAVKGNLKDISTIIEDDLASGYVRANLVATDAADRGALRALVWGEKVTKILNSILVRYEKKQDTLLENKHVYVCEICGFMYIGDELPDICPICKVPNKKIIEVKRG